MANKTAKYKVPWKKIGSKIVYKNPWVKIREDKVINPLGQKTIYGLVETPDSVYVVPVTNKKEVYLLYMYRYPTKTFSWEIVAGGSQNQPLLTAAKRELKEEMNLTAKKWTKINSFQPFNGLVSEWGHLFIAENLNLAKQNFSQDQKEEGIMKIKKMPFKKALRMIKTGEITDSLSIMALTVAGMKLGHLTLTKTDKTDIVRR